MKIKVLVYSICIFIIILIQTTVLDYARIFHIKPNLLVVFIVSVALLSSSLEGAVIGFIAGFSQDIVSGRVIGLYSLLGLYLGLIIGSVNKRLYRENFLVIIFFTFVSSVAYEFSVYTLNWLAMERLDFLFSLRNIILPEAIYNSIISIIIYIVVIKIDDRFEIESKFTRKY